MSARILFSVEKIDVFYGSSQILFGVDIELAEGQTMALLRTRTAPAKARRSRRLPDWRRRAAAASPSWDATCKAASRI